MLRRPHRPKKLAFRALCALLPFLVLAGCSHEPKPSALVSAKGAFGELRRAVLHEIRDPGKAVEVTGLVDQLEQLMIETSEARTAHIARIRLLNANYNATEEDFRNAFREFNTKRGSRQDGLLAIDQRARALTTSREWKALSKDVAHALEDSVKAEQESVLQPKNEKQGGPK